MTAGMAEQRHLDVLMGGLRRRRRAEWEYLKRAKTYGATVYLLNALNSALCDIARETV
jgi:hypothetical protein